MRLTFETGADFLGVGAGGWAPLPQEKRYKGVRTVSYRNIIDLI